VTVAVRRHHQLYTGLRHVLRNPHRHALVRQGGPRQLRFVSSRPGEIAEAHNPFSDLWLSRWVAFILFATVRIRWA